MDLSFAHDPDWLDREYNNRARVSDNEAYLARWARESLAVRERGEAMLDLPYGEAAGETLDIFPAALNTGEAAPVLFFIHGGYWRALDKSDHSFLAPAFQRLGACVVVPNYALCPGNSVPGITLQMVKALAWTQRRIAAHGGDPQRITVAGHSAGGQLAAMMLACRWAEVGADLPAALVRNALCISGLFDLAPLHQAPFMQPVLQLTPEQVQRASPARLPSPGLHEGRGQLVAVVGGEESSEYHRQNRLIRAAWGERVVPVCEELPGLHHFSVVDALAQPGHRLHTLARELLGL